MAVTTGESNVPEEVLSGWRTEYGHRAEENFGVSLSKLGAEELKEDPPPQKSEELTAEGRIAFRRASAKEDFDEGIDFHLFNPLTGRMTPVDISVSKNPAVHAGKREREREGGPLFLPLNARDLENASRGSERAGEEVWRSVNVLLLEDALRQSRSGEVPISPPKMALIEQKLQKLQGGVK